MRQTSLHTPIGEITLFATGDALTAVEWGRGGGGNFEDRTDPLLAEARRQLDAYFDGLLLAFDLPLDPSGTDFQKRVWTSLQTIPLGRTSSYGEIAKSVGSAPRAIGQATARNPLPILIPCHRVLGAAGWIGGYSGGDGTDTKLWLLSHEARMRSGDRHPDQQETQE